MDKNKHLILIIVTILAWAIFYLIGIPSNYYLTWSQAEKILILWLGLFAILPMICFFLIVFLGGDYVKTSMWVAFYASFGLFVLDYIAVGLIEGKGIGFLITHWPQSIGYIEAWIVMPLVGIALKKLKANTQ